MQGTNIIAFPITFRAPPCQPFAARDRVVVNTSRGPVRGTVLWPSHPGHPSGAPYYSVQGDDGDRYVAPGSDLTPEQDGY